jgi:hypothetical protein
MSTLRSKSSKTEQTSNSSKKKWKIIILNYSIIEIKIAELLATLEEENRIFKSWIVQKDRYAFKRP